MMEGKGRGELGNIAEGQEGGGACSPEDRLWALYRCFCLIVLYHTNAWPCCVHVFYLCLAGSV